MFTQMGLYVFQFLILVPLKFILDWTPSLTTAKVCLSILSMLSSCKKKEPPANDKSSMAYFKGKSPKQVTWYTRHLFYRMYEDDKC